MTGEIRELEERINVENSERVININMPESKSRIKDFLGLDNHQNNWWPALRENSPFYFAKASCSSFAHNHFLFFFRWCHSRNLSFTSCIFNHIIQTFHSLILSLNKYCSTYHVSGTRLGSRRPLTVVVDKDYVTWPLLAAREAGKYFHFPASMIDERQRRKELKLVLN